MHTGHFQAIARRSNGGKITIGCRAATPIIDLLKGNDFVEDVIGFGDGADRNRVVVTTAASKLKAARFDSFFCLKSNPRLVSAAWLAGIPRRFGYMQKLDPRSMLLSTRVAVPKVTKHPLHMSKADLLLDHLGVPYDHASARLHPKTDALQEARQLAGDGKLIAIGVNASVPQRQWGERFVPLVHHLHDVTGARFVMFGGADVREVAANIILGSRLPSSSFIDLTSMGASLALSHAVLSLCQLYVGNDSSGLNLAVMSGLPGIGFFSLAPPLTYSDLIIPVEPVPAGAGVDGISVERVTDITLRVIRQRCPHLLA